MYIAACMYVGETVPTFSQIWILVSRSPILSLQKILNGMFQQLKISSSLLTGHFHYFNKPD